MAELDIGSLYLEHGECICRFIGRCLGDSSIADDLLQECFVTAFRSRAQYDPQKGSPRMWLYGIAANLCRRHRRGAFRFGRLKEALTRLRQPPATAAPDEDVERQQRIAVLRRALQRLPYKQREVFVLYELEEQDGPAIAKTLGIPEGTVWTRLHHARRSFRKHLERHLDMEVMS